MPAETTPMDDRTAELAPNSYEEDTITDPALALIEACLNKNIAEIEYVIQTNKNDPQRRQCARGGTENAEILVALMKYTHFPLSYSIGSDEFISRVVYSGDLDIFEAVLTIGWDPCSPLKYLGDTLTYAVMKNKLLVVSRLLDHGAKYDANEAGSNFPFLLELYSSRRLLSWGAS
ncbi:hypothetical protein C0995_003087 [Termitomyces sp. Mi166|nr:hypothetical protein C0995_003087 [Termitomyces sp. Mi166\